MVLSHEEILKIARTKIGTEKNIKLNIGKKCFFRRHCGNRMISVEVGTEAGCEIGNYFVCVQCGFIEQGYFGGGAD